MTGELRRGAPIRGVIGGATEGTITTGGFTYDEATLTGLVKEWIGLADDYANSLRESERLTLVKGPGLDFASTGVANAANLYGRAYLKYLQENHDYCIGQAQLCQNALDDYLGIERRNVTELYGSSQSSGDSVI
jgi:hypothetical protein